MWHEQNQTFTNVRFYDQWIKVYNALSSVSLIAWILMNNTEYICEPLCHMCMCYISKPLQLPRDC